MRHTSIHPLPAPWRFLRHGSSLLLATVVGCSVVVSAHDLDEEACAPESEKLCEDSCVSVADPAVGCSADSCAPCHVPHATPRCDSNEQCAIAVCHAGYDDCDRDGTTGCEADLRIDADHCGDCDRKCPDLPQAVRGCNGRECTILACEEGFRDCDGQTANGCECGPAAGGESCGADGSCLL